MRGPFVLRREHDAFMAGSDARFEAAESRHESEVAAMREELTRVRQSLLESRNEAAELRGQIVAKWHGDGKPAQMKMPSEFDDPPTNRKER